MECTRQQCGSKTLSLESSQACSCFQVFNTAESKYLNKHFDTSKILLWLKQSHYYRFIKSLCQNPLHTMLLFCFQFIQLRILGEQEAIPAVSPLTKRQVTGLILAENANPLRGSMSKSIQCNTQANRTCTVTCCDNSL